MTPTPDPQSYIPGYRIRYLELETVCAWLKDNGWAGGIGFDEAVKAMALAARSAPPLDARIPYGVVPAGCRLILASEDVLDQWGTRTERGERITVEWGEPSLEGWYEPRFTVHSDDTLAQRSRTLDALDDAIATLRHIADDAEHRLAALEALAATP